MLTIQSALTWGGRILLALYFLLPGISKFTDFDKMVAYMTDHGMIAVPFFLVLTGVLQISAAVALLVGIYVRATAFMLAGMVLVISLVMHDFWNITEAVQYGHEMQNFIKNMAIMAGLMILAGNPAMMGRRLFGKAGD